MESDPVRTVLWSAIEDYAGLWEVAWKLHPEARRISDSERNSAREVVRDLLQRQLINLYWLIEPDEDPVQVVSPKEAEDLLEDSRSWEEPGPGARSVRIGATEAGERAYAELLRQKEAQPRDRR